MVFTRERLEKLLLSTKDDALYDEWNGIRAAAMETAGFYPNYLTYYVGQQQHKMHAPNWVNTRTAFRDNMRDSKGEFWRIIHWTFWPGLPTTRPNVTHARGLFVSRQLKLVVVYEPRKLKPADVPVARHRMYNRTHSEFCKYFGNSYQFITVFGSQVRSWDCEKRVLRFGMCCLQDVVAFADQHGVHNITCARKRCWLKVSAILPFYKRR